MKRRFNKLKHAGVALVAVFALGACSPQEIVWHFFPDEYETAVEVVQCESEWDVHAVNPNSGASGLFQIHPFWNKPGHSDPVADYIGRHWDQRFDPLMNAKMAQMIRNTPRGWDHWACY